jgi:hypothetical protein
MRRLISAMTAGLVLSGTVPLSAQDESTPQEQAVIKEGEVGRLDPGSVKAYGPVARFQVSIAWDEAGGQPPAGHMSRTVSYVADCKSGTLTLAAIAVLGSDGKLIKNTLIPPGAADSTIPKRGSTEAHWLREACSK